jgi:hypothetical protein
MASVDSSLLGGDDVLRDATTREVSQAVFCIRSVRRLYPSTKLNISMIGSVKPLFTEDLCIVEKQEFSITCYMCNIYT